MQEHTLDRLQRLRNAWAKPIIVTSGYRCAEHPVEKAKPNGPGAHSTGCAVDIRAIGRECYELLALALPLGFTGVGISQRTPQPRFIHLDDAPITGGLVRPAVWSY